MSLYREVGRVRPWIVLTAAVLLLAIGFGAGFATARSTAGDADLGEAVASIQNDVRMATDALELVGIEYEQAVANGAVQEQTEYEAARADAARAQGIFAANREELLLLSPEATEEAERALEELIDAIEARAELADVIATAEEAARALRSAARLP